MAKYDAKTGQSWTEDELNQLRDLAKGTPTRVIGLKLQRSESSVRSKAQREGVSLAPTNQSPYG